MPASDALAQRAMLAEELTSGPYERFLADMVPSMQNPDVGAPMVPRHWTWEHVRDDMLLALRASETYYITPDMMSLAVAGMETLPEDAVVRKESPMSSHGFMWMPAALRIVDVRGYVLAVNAVLWAEGPDGVLVWMFADKYDPLNDAFQRAKGYEVSKHGHLIPRLTPWGALYIKYGQPLPKSLKLKGQRPVPPDVPVQVVEKDGSVAWLIGDGGMSPEDMQPVRAPADEALFLTVVWRLMRQTIVDVREEEVDKRSRRLAQRHLNAERHVTVIALRHKESRRDGDRTWSLDHRFLVRGHWRHQWYGSGEHRWQDWVWIAPFIKGPEGAPLIVTDKVNALVR